MKRYSSSFTAASRLRVLVMGLMAGGSLVFALAQEEPKKEERAAPKPERAHEWLKKFAGTWETESEGFMGPDQPPVKGTGTITARTLGPFWVVNEWKAEMGGHAVSGLQTIGYDPEKRKYIGTWIDSATSHLWTYEGFIEEKGRKLILEATGPNPMREGMESTFRDAYEFKSDDELILTSSMLTDDGEWIPFLNGTGKRVKE